jgi:plasmid stabilization system protein ParE
VSLLVRQSERFEIDVRLQADWYLNQGAFTAAKDFAQAVESTLALLATQPFIGPECDYPESELAALRVFLVRRPFQRFLIFYRVTASELHVFRVVEGHRDLPRRLLDPPGAE